MKLLRRFFGLQASYMTTYAKLSQIFITSSTYNIMTSWQVSWFSDFVCFLYNLKTTRPRVRGHVSWIRCSKLVVWSWIRPHIILNNMNIIFSLFEWLAVIICIIQENSIKWNKLKKYRKSPRNVPHWNMEHQVLYEDCRKSLEVKSGKKYGLPSVKKDTRQITTLPSVRRRHSAKG